MVTKYDVFAQIIEKAPCMPKDLGFTSAVSFHINELLNRSYIKRTQKGYIPIKNVQTQAIFEIIKLSLKQGLNYNIFFSKDMYLVLDELNKNTTDLRPKSLANNKNYLRILEFLETNHFVLVNRKKPTRGTLLKHSIYNYIANFNNAKKIIIKEQFLSKKYLIDKLLKLPKLFFNPFEQKYFEYITGSAQLEGSTVNIGETIKMLVEDIYPNKKHKEIQMVKNLDEAMNFVIDNIDNKLTVDFVCQINKRVLFSLHKGAGELKKTQNKILGNPTFKTTKPHLVFSELSKFCTFFNSIQSREEVLENIGKIHNYLQRIHPFVDGNSRTTRIVVNWLLIKHNFPMLIFKSGSFEKYMSLTKLSSIRDDGKLTYFFLALLLHNYIKN